MALRKRLYAVAVAVSAALMLQATSCGESEIAVHRYELSGCPHTSFSLPRLVLEPPYELASGRRHWSRTPEIHPAMCRGFTYYEVDAPGRGAFRRGATPAPWGVDVRLNRGPSCSLDVAYGYLLPLQKERQAEARRWFDRELGGKVDTVARLVLRGSNVTPIVPASQIERVRRKELEAWCARSGDQAALSPGGRITLDPRMRQLCAQSAS